MATLVPGWRCGFTKEESIIAAKLLLAVVAVVVAVVVKQGPAAKFGNLVYHNLLSLLQVQGMEASILGRTETIGVVRV